MIRVYKVKVTTDKGVTYTDYLEAIDLALLVEEHPTWTVKVEKF